MDLLYKIFLDPFVQMGAARRTRLVTSTRSAAFALGMAALVLALTSPLDESGPQATIDALAIVQATAAGPIPPGTRLTAQDGLLVAVLGALTTQDAETLLRAHRRAASGVAVLLDVDTWRATDSPDPNRGAAILRGAGWRVVVARAGDDLTTLWPQVARGSRIGVGV